MKIVHISYYFEDALGYQENILPQYHSELGNDVVLITSTSLPNKKNGTCKTGEYFYKGFKVKRIEKFFEFKDRFVIYKNLYSVLDYEKPDYIFMHGITTGALPVVAKYKKEHPYVYLATDNHADLNISAKRKLWKLVYYNLFWKKIIALYDRYVDVYFGVTPIRCAFLHEELGVSKEKIRLLPIGSDVKATTSQNVARTREKYGIHLDAFCFVHGGKMSKKKQVNKLIEAFKMIDNPKIRLILFGKFEDEQVAKTILDDNRIIYLGWLNRKDTLDVLAMCDVGIWNTQHTTLLEDAVAVELPLILRYYGSTSHLIKHSGLFLYEGETREIYDKMEFLSTHQDVVKEFKRNAKELKEIISYENVARESLGYMNNLEPQHCHQLFMSSQYTDWNYTHLRKL